MANDSLLDGLEPEMEDGPLGLPVLKPKAAPDLPDMRDMDLPELDNLGR